MNWIGYGSLGGVKYSAPLVLIKRNIHQRNLHQRNLHQGIYIKFLFHQNLQKYFCKFRILLIPKNVFTSKHLEGRSKLRFHVMKFSAKQSSLFIQKSKGPQENINFVSSDRSSCNGDDVPLEVRSRQSTCWELNTD